MSFTQQYGRIHAAIWTVAKASDLEGAQVRVLLALFEAGGSATSQELYDNVPGINQTAIRRASLYLREQGFIRVKSADEKRPRDRGFQGAPVRFTLTDDGAAVAHDVLAILKPALVAES